MIRLSRSVILGLINNIYFMELYKGLKEGKNVNLIPINTMRVTYRLCPRCQPILNFLPCIWFLSLK